MERLAVKKKEAVKTAVAATVRTVDLMIVTVHQMVTAAVTVVTLVQILLPIQVDRDPQENTHTCMHSALYTLQAFCVNCCICESSIVTTITNYTCSPLLSTN